MLSKNFPLRSPSFQNNENSSNSTVSGFEISAKFGPFFVKLAPQNDPRTMKVVLNESL